MASRHLSRTSVLQALFSADMLSDLSSEAVLAVRAANARALPQEDEDAPFADALLRGIVAKREEIDAVIERAAPQWPLEKIAAIDRNVLRLGLYELLFGADAAVPPKVALNEAIELAKTFGGESSSRFVNGVLGSVYRELGSPRQNEAPKPAEPEHFAGLLVATVERGELYVALIKDAFDTWTLPKSRIEAGELSDSAALRAALDDLGLSNLAVAVPLAEHEYEAHDAAKHQVVKRRAAYFVACAPRRVALTPSSESAAKEARWYAAHELDSLALYEDLRDTIERGMVLAERHCV